MKFAHAFAASLSREDYPRAWIGSAIQYRQLKKCIKRVQQELQSLGLDAEFLEQLWQAIELNEDRATATTRSDDNDNSAVSHPDCVSIGCSTFRPRLNVRVDPTNGTPLDAWLSAETLEYLRSLSRPVVTETLPSECGRLLNHHGSKDHGQLVRSELPSLTDKAVSVNKTDSERLAIPLASDSEFFQTLHAEIRDLGRLQKVEQNRLEGEILRLGEHLNAITQNKPRKSKAEINAWRQIFGHYLDSKIFFSPTSQGAEPCPSEVAQQRLESFNQAITPQNRKKNTSNAQDNPAINSFIHINLSLLQFLKFQEINCTALTKILKKFEKRTALHAQATSKLPTMLMQEPFVTENLAKATCFTIKNSLLSVIPQLDDFLCPICFAIAYKPVRLRCQHIFCIRCLLVMQNAQKDHCPLCRDNVVMEATPEHLDLELLNFLRSRFPDEVKTKQKENDHAVGVCLYGEGYDKCLMM